MIQSMTKWPSGPPLEPPLKRQHQGTDQPLELPRRVFDRAIRLRLAGGRKLQHSLHAQAPCGSPAQAPA
eukprot:7520068-Alexandrium_andersonii.AAC.1